MKPKFRPYTSTSAFMAFAALALGGFGCGPMSKTQSCIKANDASKQSYEALVRCEGGTVVFDRIERDGSSNVFQLVLHDNSVQNFRDRVGPGYGNLYNGGRTLVIPVREHRQARFDYYLPSRDAGKISVFSADQELTLVSSYFRDGNDYHFDYRFHGCRAAR